MQLIELIFNHKVWCPNIRIHGKAILKICLYRENLGQ